MTADYFKSVTRQRRIRGAWPRRRWLFWITFPHERVEIRKNRGGKQERIILVNQRRLKGRLVTQRPNHQLCGLCSARIGVGMLPRRQFVVRSNPRADECRHEQRRPRGIHQAESYRLEKRARVVESTHGLTVEMPLLRARLEKFCVGHYFD